MVCTRRGMVGADARPNWKEQVKRFEPDRNAMALRSPMWSTGSLRSYQGAPRFPKLSTIGMVESRIERGDKIETERRSYISSRVLSAAAFAKVVRGHWAIENNLHWSLDVTFNEDQSRLRAGHGAKNMAVVRHFALNLVRQVADKRSIKRRRKRASWDPKYLLEILGPPQLNLDSLPWVRPTSGLLAGRGGLLCFGLAAIQQWRRIIIHASR